ncbi:hypothetical protein M9M90_11555 [Phenylobacterium sp. LH3H17]|uniref:hypothetical protein n=1 Tax=Phenylobacterium sp. LH3H17 TaxID=2903901 RepID=UPI0020C94D44|nr:hypothetical protein [Phenylobacterium sp. LH3H17]UTP37875.1 hypothetical protein M9M90_11555 [Phenylobacterium sp. LH3H17]
MIIKVLGAVLCGVGLIWILQGVGVLPGSFMTGQSLWAVIGGLALIVGLVILTLGRRSRRDRASEAEAPSSIALSGAANDGPDCGNDGGGAD